MDYALQLANDIMRFTVIALLLCSLSVNGSSEHADASFRGSLRERKLTQPYAAANRASDALRADAQQSAESTSGENDILLSVVSKLNNDIATKNFRQAQAAASYIVQLLDDKVDTDRRPAYNTGSGASNQRSRGSNMQRSQQRSQQQSRVRENTAVRPAERESSSQVWCTVCLLSRSVRL